jgi:hypothetical protein
MGAAADAAWPAGLALIGVNSFEPDWAIRLKTPLPSLVYSATLVGAAFVFNVLPFVSEARRSARASRERAKTQP